MEFKSTIFHKMMFYYCVIFPGKKYILFVRHLPTFTRQCKLVSARQLREIAKAKEKQ